MVLREVAQGQVARLAARAGACHQQSGQQLHERRLARAIAPEQRDAIAGQDGHAAAGEQRALAVADALAIEHQQRARQLRRLRETELERR